MDHAAHLDETSVALAELMAQRRGDRRIACAESFTAGLLCQTLAAVEGAGSWFSGGVVTYRPEQKRSLLGVRAASVVSEQAATEMAVGATQLFGTAAAVATTGVAGPGVSDGEPPGTVVIGWCVDGVVGATTLHLPGRPGEVVLRGTRAALGALARALGDAEPHGTGDACGAG
jgi:nicotinamide-nucleotide amidase